MHILPLEPMPCPRPRIALRGRFPTAYYPKKYQEWKDEAVKLLKIIRGNAQPYTLPLTVDVVFFCNRPRTTKRLTPKGDIDNYVKSLLDALTQAGWWVDDSLVYHIDAEKCFRSCPTSHIAFSIRS